jgi:hypothetical protein
MSSRSANLLAALFWALGAGAAFCFILGDNLLGSVLSVGWVVWVLREAVVSDRGES